MDGPDVVLFLHIAVVIGGLMLAAVMHTALLRVRVAAEVGELRVWGRIVHRLEPLLPTAAVVIFGTGAWLVVISDGEFRFADGWVVVSIVGLVLAEVLGAALRTKTDRLQAAIAAAPDGPVSGELHRTARDASLLVGGHVATALFFGIAYLMVLKPSALGSTVALVIAAAVGIGSALPFLSERARVAAA